MKESKNVDGSEELSALLASFQAFITYVPLPSEIAPEPLPEGALIYEIPPRAESDPAQEAWNAILSLGEATVAVLVPGTRFDATGTRHGRGGGWYDRFLSQIPREWVRIGFCSEEQFSEELLKREPWDEPMDVVCVFGKEKVTIHRPSNGILEL
jgi:hypothetical protein